MPEFIIMNTKVIPQSKKNVVEDLTIEDNGSFSLKVRITAPPDDGKANQALVDILGKYFSVKKRDIEIIKGHTSRQKLIKVYNPILKMAQPKLPFA